ncbi:MAG: Wzz/FepE/Etk N-terminal domain-containing protein [Alphaproteobacteria bacterium]|jgi:LPS O-antigen subunit length determinant protein (WzzB/FepE family)|nr:Wzz/FepE/Etk N-terminal domain-containing protein [Alphaproteobacteria bacterium]
MSEIPRDEIDLVELFQVIWDGKWLIAGLSALIITPAFAFWPFEKLRALRKRQLCSH